MNDFWHDYSQRTELATLARAAADLARLAGPIWDRTLITGALARDLHLFYRFEIAIARETEDLDFAFAVSDWSDFEGLRQRLIDSGRFHNVRDIPHRLRHRQGLLVDIVPFGGIETNDRKIIWPAPTESIMDVFGFQEALSSAHRVLLPGKVSTLLVSYPALVVLKLVCWHDRHYRSPRKDADDINLLLTRYLDAGQQDRLWEDFVHWTQDEDFEYEQVGPRMLGVDAQILLGDDGCRRIVELLQTQIDPDAPGVLPVEMDRDNPDRARGLLAALCRGLADGGPP